MLLNGDRRALLQAVRASDQRIVAIYEKAAEELARKAGAAKTDSLSERWAKDYEASLRESIAQMRKELSDAIESGAAAAAKLPADATTKWLEQIRQRTGIDERFRGVLSSAPTEALRAMLEGKMYSDGKTLSSRIWDNTGRLQGGIEDVVTQGIAQGRSAYQMAKDLEAYVNPNAAEPYLWNTVYPDTPFPLVIEYNAQRLARTSISHAWWGAAKKAAQLNPLCIGMQWLLSSSHLARQVLPFGPDICDTYAEHDEGLGVGVYPIDKLPMPHPQCLCTQAQAVPEIDEAVDRIQSWMSGGSDPALERGFAQWQADHGVESGRATRSVSARTAKSKELDSDYVSAIMKEAERPGGRHNGKLHDMQRYTDKGLERSAHSSAKTIAEHEHKIAHPEMYIDDWDQWDERKKNGLLRKWEKDIHRNREQQAIAESLLEGRKRNG